MARISVIDDDESTRSVVGRILEMAGHAYRPALGIDKALTKIAQNRGILYDPDVADTCIRLFDNKEFRF